MTGIVNRIFYAVKPFIPRVVQIYLRRKRALYLRKKYSHVWPIDPTSAKAPDGWKGWPDGRQFALVLSHDVDTRKGYDNTLRLADIEENMGFRSQFNFVPERYGKVEIKLLEELKRRGFGIGVHGLKHDGKLFSSRDVFCESASRIEAYLNSWGTKSFTAPAMIRNHLWMLELGVDYCTSTFDTDPFEPQSDGVGTIFPFWVQNESSDHRFLELPYTLVQDFTLFVILQEKNIDIWKRKVNWVAENGGMVLLNSHPDYMCFDEGECLEQYPLKYYTDLLEHLKKEYKDMFWHALPARVYNHFRVMV